MDRVESQCASLQEQNAILMEEKKNSLKEKDTLEREIAQLKESSEHWISKHSEMKKEKASSSEANRRNTTKVRSNGTDIGTTKGRSSSSK